MKKWDYRYVINKIKKLEEMLDKETNERKFIKLEETISDLKQIAYDVSPTFKIGFKRKKSVYDKLQFLKDEMSFIKKFGYYIPYIREFADNAKIIEYFPGESLSTIKFNLNSIIFRNNSFYSSMGGSYKKANDEMNEDLIRYRIKPCKSPVSEYANTYIVRNLKTFLLDYGYNNTLQDYLTFIHERCHILSLSMNREHFLDYNKFLLREVDSLFFELYASEYVGNFTNIDDSIKISTSLYTDILLTANFIIAKIDMYNDLSVEQILNPKTVDRYLKAKYGNDEAFIDEVKNISIMDNLNYVFSYLVATELVSMCLSHNKDKALELVEGIVKSKDKNPEEYLSELINNGIVPGKNISIYSDYLRGKIKDYGKKEVSHRY